MKTIFRRTKVKVNVKVKVNSVVMSKFSYCPLIWPFCSKVANNEVNRTHKRALRTSYRDYNFTFEELLDRGDTKTTHKENLQNLMVKIYKSMKEGALSWISSAIERAPTKEIPLHATSQVNCYFLCVIISTFMLFVVIVCS